MSRSWGANVAWAALATSTALTVPGIRLTLPDDHLGLGFSLNSGALAQQSPLSIPQGGIGNNASPSAGQLPIAQTASTTAWETITGCTLTTAGTLTCPTGSGTIVAGTGLSGGTITNNGTIAFQTIAADTYLGNTGTAAGVPSAVSICNYDSIITSGTSWTAPACITSNTVVHIKVAAGGGGGGGSNTSADMGGPGGGAAGFEIVGTNIFSSGSAYPYAIGQGGTAGGTASAGGTGGTSDIVIAGTTYAASGGAGGLANLSAQAVTAGGTIVAGGTPTVSVPGIVGLTLSPGTAGNLGVGGGGPFGVGAGATTTGATGVNGTAATGFGAGGSGGRSASGSAQTGGQGSSGLLEIILNGS